jgi:pilus assembly protein CpaB
MKMKSLVLIIIALGCGLVATIGISQVMDKGSGGAATMQMEQILVAKGDIDIGAALDANSVQLEEWPAAKVPEGAVRSLEEVTDKFPQARFYKGEPILLPKISDQNRTPSSRIEEGYRTATIKVDEDTVMEGIGPGDRVDVMVFLRKGDGVQQAGVYPIIKNVRVFSKGAQTERVVDAKSGQETRARTISLMLKLAQCQEVALAAEMGRIRLALRNPNDDSSGEKDEMMPLSELLNGKVTNGDDKKKPASTGTNDLIAELKNAVAVKDPVTTPVVPTVAEPARGPSFVMTVQGPNEIKSYQWNDVNALPTETLLLSMGTGNTLPPVPLPATLDSTPASPPVPAEGDSKGYAE